MTNLSPEFCFKVREARRSAKISQGELAAEVGCKQSAISMFEQGDGTKLNDEVIGKIAKKFGLDITSKEEGNPGSALMVPAHVCHNPHSGFCPNANCPSNHRYQVDGRQLARPERESADPVGGRFCAMCGTRAVVEGHAPRNSNY